MELSPELAGALAAAATGGQTRVVDPSVVAEASPVVRAAVAFCLVAVVGGLLVRRAGDVVERARATWTDEPLASLGYGLATHAVVVFAGVYLGNQLSTFGVFGAASGDVGLAVAVALVGLAGALGFTVVGSYSADLAFGASEQRGLVAGAVAAAATAAAPLSVGPFVWFVVVSLGIGGAVKEWLHASFGPGGASESAP